MPEEICGLVSCVRPAGLNAIADASSARATKAFPWARGCGMHAELVHLAR